MGPVSHFLFGALCGAAIGGVAVVVRRRLALYLPPFVLACGFWGEMPWLLGTSDTTHPLANVFFGYAWLHPWLRGHDSLGFVLLVVVANVLMLGYVVFVTWHFWTVDSIRWEQEGVPASRRRRSKRHSRRRRQ